MFVLRISVAPSAIERIKVQLTQSLPDVKSSHRVEALGRGLGFRTYAALRAVSQVYSFRSTLAPSRSSRSRRPLLSYV